MVIIERGIKGCKHIFKKEIINGVTYKRCKFCDRELTNKSVPMPTMVTVSGNISKTMKIEKPITVDVT